MAVQLKYEVRVGPSTPLLHSVWENLPCGDRRTDGPLERTDGPSFPSGALPAAGLPRWQKRAGSSLGRGQRMEPGKGRVVQQDILEEWDPQKAEGAQGASLYLVLCGPSPTAHREAETGAGTAGGTRSPATEVQTSAQAAPNG